MTGPAVERCTECGFDGADWTDEGAIAALAELPARWAAAIEGLGNHALGRRPIESMWSIAEYTDHVRETTFGMRFVLDVALADSGAVLGEAPTTPFAPEPRDIDAERAWRGFDREVGELLGALRRTPATGWGATAVISGDVVDVHWIARHILHDVTHHLGDLARLRAVVGD